MENKEKKYVRCGICYSEIKETNEDDAFGYCGCEEDINDLENR